MPAGDALVGVVIAAHNLEGFIAETIESVLAQTFRRFELIVVVDSSTDATAAIARRYGDPRIEVVEVEVRSAGGARNVGLRQVSAPYVLFLDGDDLLVPTALEHFAQGFAEAPDAIAVVAAHQKIDEEGQPLPGEDAASRPAFPSADGLRHLLQRNTITNGGTICIRTDAARATGGYDVALREREDWDFWCRLACTGRFVSLGQVPTLLYRQRRFNTYTRPFAGPPPAIAKVYALPGVRARFSAKELRAMHRMTVIDHFWASARASLYRGERATFLLFVLVGLVRYPDSLLRGFLLRFLARQIANRLRPSVGQAPAGGG